MIETTLGHRVELAWYLVRLVTAGFVVWELIDGWIELRQQWAGDDADQLKLAKWRLAHDFYNLATVGVYLRINGILLRNHHGQTADLLNEMLNLLVAWLLAKTIYLRWIRIGAKRRARRARGVRR